VAITTFATIVNPALLRHILRTKHQSANRRPP